MTIAPPIARVKPTNGRREERLRRKLVESATNLTYSDFRLSHNAGRVYAVSDHEVCALEPADARERELRSEPRSRYLECRALPLLLLYADRRFRHLLDRAEKLLKRRAGTDQGTTTGSGAIQSSSLALIGFPATDPIAVAVDFDRGFG